MRRCFYLLLFISLICYALELKSQDSDAAQTKSFNLSSNSIGALQNSVNLFNGQVTFPLNIATIQGKGGLSYAVNLVYNSTGVDRSVKTINEFQSTGILGLGWSLDLPRIVVDNKQTGTRHDDVFYLLEGGSSNQLVCTSHTPTLRKYSTKNFNAWKIEYQPDEELWTITRENGFKYQYGGKNSGLNTVQWSVKWGNWIGDSTQPLNQSQTAYTWNLWKIENLWNESLEFEYEVVKEFVANSSSITTEKEHTKASYLKKISDAWGQSIELAYLEKASTEFYEPHTEKAEPDGYQEKYETKYLSDVIVKTLAQTDIYSVKLLYDQIPVVGFSDTKRILTSIQKRFPGNETQPPTFFEYFKEGSNLGYLKKVSNTLGARIEYYYQEVDISGSSLDVNVVETGYGQPKAYTTDNYTIVTLRQLNTDGTIDNTGNRPVKIFALYWDGRWIQEELWQTTSVSNTNYEKSSIALSENHFIYRILKPNNEHDLYFARKSPDYSGTGHWVKQLVGQGVSSGDPNLNANLMSGDNYVAFVNRFGGSIRTFVWIGDSWVEKLLGVPEYPYELFCAGGHNYMIIHNDNYGNADKIHFFYLDEEKKWNDNLLPAGVSFNTDGSASLGDSYWHTSKSFAVVLPIVNPEYIYMWDEDYSNFQKIETLGLLMDYLPVSLIDNSQVSIGDEFGNWISARYDGKDWIKTVYAAFPLYRLDYSFGKDYVIFQKPFPSPFKEIVINYDVNSRSWGNSTEWPQNGTGFLNTNEGRAIDAGYGMFSIKDGWIYKRSNTGFWSTNTKIPLYTQVPLATLHYIMGKSLRNMAPNFLTYEYSESPTSQVGGTYIAFLENNEVKGYLLRSGFLLSDDKHNVGITTLALYLGNTVSVYRVINGQATGILKTKVVKDLFWSDGSSLFATSFSYSNSKATYGGETAQFNYVKTIPGSNLSTVTPYGYTENYFYNGLPESQLLVQPPVSNNSKENLLLGLPYQINVYNSSQTLIGNSKVSYQVGSTPILNSNSEAIEVAYSARPIKSEQTLDGLLSVSESTYDNSTGLITQSKQFNSMGQGQAAEQLTTDYIYWWQAYDNAKALNILSPVVQTISRRDGVAVESGATKWRFDSGVNKYFPDRTFEWRKTGSEVFAAWPEAQVPSSDWRELSRNTVIDNTDGSVLETSSDEIVSSVIYNTSRTRVIASANYTTADKIAFSSFEPNAPYGTWALNIAFLTNIESVTGKYCFRSIQLSPPDPLYNDIVKTIPFGIYEISYWYKTETPSILFSNGSLINSTSLETKNGWTLTRATVDIASGGGTLTLRIPVNGLLDELRLKPKDAEMTSFVYNEVGTIQTQVDTNLKQSVFEYDNQHRLIVIRDHFGNILKRYEHYFRDQ